MADTIVLKQSEFALRQSEFELPEDAKITKVFERLMRVNAAVTENGLHEMYTERHDKYSEAYGIGF